MNFKEYAEAVERTSNPDLTDAELASNWALGIAGESGEVVEIIKKYLYHGKGLDHNDLQSEIGDLMYYVQAMCNRFNYSLEAIMHDNSEKLRKRYPEGFEEGGGIR